MKILVIGSGGREHAIAWRLTSNPRVQKVYVAPGNAGTALEPGLENVALSSVAELLAFAQKENIHLTVVGPEVPLVKGIVDAFQAEGLRIFGPTAGAARLEGSKAFSKDFMTRYGIPTAAFQTFRELNPALTYLEKTGAPVVVKASGLAAGKGAVVCQTLTEAREAVESMLGPNAIFGEAGSEVVIEEFMEGEEASFFALCDGDNAIALASAQDHKRVGDGDTGPNTGGMGAYSPAPVMTPEMTKRTMDEIILPTVRAMKAMGAPYRGVLFAGLMITKDGPKLIEYNVRFGDPETQVLMLRMMSDIVPALIAARDGQLKAFDLRWYPDAALTVVMAANGYPGDYQRGTAIEGLGEAAKVEGVEIFHAGTKADGGKILANGGRVLNVSALGKSVSEAQARAYQAIDRIKWPEGFCRRDIGWQAVKREKSGG
mgnify:CR=1 FL=1